MGSDPTFRITLRIRASEKGPLLRTYYVLRVFITEDREIRSGLRFGLLRKHKMTPLHANTSTIGRIS